MIPEYLRPKRSKNQQLVDDMADEEVINEFELIQKKQSKLPTAARDLIVDKVERSLRSFLKSQVRENK